MDRHQSIGLPTPPARHTHTPLLVDFDANTLSPRVGVIHTYTQNRLRCCSILASLVACVIVVLTAIIYYFDEVPTF